LVKDNEIEIKKEFHDELFKKFYQIYTSATKKHGGVGLGLSICQGTVKGMKCKRWLVHSSPLQYKQEVVMAEEAEQLIMDGYEFVANLPNEKVVVRKGSGYT